MPPLNGSALAMPALTVLYQRLMAPIIALAQLLTSLGFMNSGHPSGGAAVLLLSVSFQLETSLIAVPTSVLRGA